MKKTNLFVLFQTTGRLLPKVLYALIQEIHVFGNVLIIAVTPTQDMAFIVECYVERLGIGTEL